MVVSIEAYPSNHIDSFRALENPKFILIDEGDFFRKSEQDDVRFVTESISVSLILILSWSLRLTHLTDFLKR